MDKVFVRTEFNYDRRKASKESALVCKDKSLTQQHEKEEADINVIVKRFGLTGEVPGNIRTPQYGDFSGISDYQTAMQAIKLADEAFYSLPAYLRSRFNNNPEEFVSFCSDEKNREEAIKLGLVKKKDDQTVKNVKTPEEKERPAGEKVEKPVTPPANG